MLRVLARFRELFMVALIGIVGLLYWVSHPGIDNVVLHRQGEATELSIPVSVTMKKGEVFKVEMDVSSGWASDFSMEIHPDNCVLGFKVNGVDLPFSDYPGYCSWSDGFIIDKAEFLRHLEKEPSKYHLEMVMRNDGGLGGVNAKFMADSALSTCLLVVLVLCVACLLVMIGSRLKLNRRLILIFFFGLILRADYTQDTFFNDRGHDTDGHVQYIQFIAKDFHIPKKDECWTCYHPPVYYVASAGAWNLSDWLKWNPQNTVKWVDFLISLVALAFGLLCIRESLSGWPRYIAAILWSVWPSFILASPRIGNDIMFYALHILTLWGCIRYIKLDNGRYFLLAVMAAILSYWTKTTGVVALGLVGCVLLMKTIPSLLRGLNRWEWIGVVLFVASVVIAFIRLRHGDIVGNADGIDNTVLVRNNPGHFLFFDVRSFLLNPYTDPWHDNLGRQYFWSYLAKTSLFGEFRLLQTNMGHWLASLISFSFLVLLGLGLRGFWLSRWTKVKVLLTAQAFMFFAAMIVMRLKYPFACSNDFRYIVPVLLSCLPWVGEGIGGEGASTRLKVLGLIFVAVFVVCSSILMMWV